MKQDDILERILMIDYNNMEYFRERVGKRIKTAMDATGYPRNYFTRDGSDFHKSLELHMGKMKSEAIVKKYLKGEFGLDKDNKNFVGFIKGAVAFLNLKENLDDLLQFEIDKNGEIQDDSVEFLEKFKDKAHRLWENKYHIHVKLLKKMSRPEDWFQNLLKNAATISFLSISLHNTIRDSSSQIKYALKRDAKLKLAIVNPNGPGLSQCSFRSSGGWAEDVYLQEIRYTLQTVGKWMKLPDIAGKIEIRLLDYLPSYAITIIHPVNKNEKPHCHARIYPFRSSSLKGPSINPDPFEHKEWFEFLSDQFEVIWQASKSWKPL